MDMPRVELPRTFTERSGYFGPLGVLLVGALAYWKLEGLPATLRWGVLVCASALALNAWLSAKTRRITCTEQGITASTRSLRTGLRQSVCLWSDITATTYTYDRRGSANRLPMATFAVQTSRGTAVKITHPGLAYFEEFVAICNAHTPQLPYIWEHRRRPLHHTRFGDVSMAFGPADKVFQPDYFQVPRDRGGP